MANTPHAGYVPVNDDVKKKEIIEKGLEKAKPGLSQEDKEQATKTLMQNQSDKSSIKIGGEEVTVESLSFMVANSIQSIESQTDPYEEYISWIEEGQQVIVEMTTGGIEPHEVIHRTEFLDNLDQREMEMRHCMNLYARCGSPEAKKRYEFLLVKMAKLMEIRSAIKTSTKEPVEALLDPKTNDQEKQKGEEAVKFLWVVKEQNPPKLYSNEEYSMLLGVAQRVIALSAIRSLPKEKELEKDRYIKLLENRLSDLIVLRNSAVYTKDNSLQSIERLKDVQMRMAGHEEMLNIVKVATQPSKESLMSGRESQDDMDRREICNAVLEYRRRGKEVPDRILYKLGVKSFVPDYSLSEELLNKKIEGHSKADAIKRINELRGRQSILIKTKSELDIERSNLQSKQMFDAQRYAVLQRIRDSRINNK